MAGRAVALALHLGLRPRRGADTAVLTDPPRGLGDPQRRLRPGRAAGMRDIVFLDVPPAGRARSGSRRCRSGRRDRRAAAARTPPAGAAAGRPFGLVRAPLRARRDRHRLDRLADLDVLAGGLRIIAVTGGAGTDLGIVGLGPAAVQRSAEKPANPGSACLACARRSARMAPRAGSSWAVCTSRSSAIAEAASGCMVVTPWGWQSPGRRNGRWPHRDDRRCSGSWSGCSHGRRPSRESPRACGASRVWR